MPSDAPSTAPLNILLVEDHPDVARMMEVLLTDLGHGVRLAGSVREAADAARQGPTDLALTDYSLPDGNGMDVLRELRSAGVNKVILITAYSSWSLPDTQAAGFMRCLEKPIALEALSQAIEDSRTFVPSDS
jgi:CheY-like chemotaxis protein